MKKGILNDIFVIVAWIGVLINAYTNNVEWAILIMLLLVHNKIND